MQRLTVLVVGATGSIGELVVAEAIRQDHSVRALVRDVARARGLTKEAEVVVGDLTQTSSLAEALSGVDAVVFTHGTYDGPSREAERVDYGAVRNVLTALGTRSARIALMTTIGVTARESASASANARHDWKRRGERLVRASGLPYTIVRPGWFDYNGADEHRLVLLQGDRRHAGDPSDGAVAREQIAEVLVHSLTSPSALRKTFELVATKGPAPKDFDALFATATADVPGALDGVRDLPNLPIEGEPQSVRDALRALTASH